MKKSRILACMLSLGILSFAQTSSAARPYIDLCGVVTVNGVPTPNVIVQAFRCSDDTFVKETTTGELVDGVNYHLTATRPDDGTGMGVFHPTGDAPYGWTPMEVYLVIIPPDCPEGIVPCEEVAAAYFDPPDYKPTLDIDTSCPAGCRVTGGGRQNGEKTYPEARFVTHGGQVGAPVGTATPFDPDSPCIQGQWQHVRHHQGGENENFHARSFDSLMCACLGEDGKAGAIIGELCNPGDRKNGPEPRSAPANKICFSGVGDISINGGKRDPRSVLFRVDIEDRGEPGGNKLQSRNPADRYRIRIWILTEDELALLNGDDQLLGFRRAIACSVNSTVTSEISGARAPDIDDGGELDSGNHQIHPTIKECL